jgi:hypothetical protein
MSITEIAAIADVVNAAGVVGALATAAYQSRRLVLDARCRDEDLRTERALSFYRDLVVDGDTAQSFHRMSVLLRRQGTEKHGFTTWKVLRDDALTRGGLLDPDDPALEGPYEDLYQVLWFFERVDRALHFGLIHEEVTFSTIGFHCWWWGELLRELQAPKAARSIRELAPRAAEWAAKNGELQRWIEHCPMDFDGAGPAATSGGPRQPGTPAGVASRAAGPTSAKPAADAAAVPPAGSLPAHTPLVGNTDISSS